MRSRLRGRAQPAVPPARACSLVLVLACVAGAMAGCIGSHPEPQSGGSPTVRPATPGVPPATPGPWSGPAPSSTGPGTPTPQLLPRGGRTIFPAYRVIAYYGAGTTTRLGVLGHGTPAQAAARLAEQAWAYARYGRPVLPCLELVTTVAAAAPGPGGAYSTRTTAQVVQRYLDAARAHKMILMLDFQPGRDTFLDQVTAYDRFLEQPDVSVGLDPEWKMTAAQVPGRVIGRADAEQINPVIDHVAAIVARHRLPQKLFIIHQFTRFMIGHRSAVKTPPGLAVTFHIDGIGGQAVKTRKYQALAPPAATGYFAGFKLFYTADTHLMSPAQAMALRPQPEMVSYQ